MARRKPAGGRRTSKGEKRSDGTPSAAAENERLRRALARERARRRALEARLGAARAVGPETAAALEAARQRQAATAEVLGLIASSPGDARPVFHAIVRHAVRICGAHVAIVVRYDGALLHLAGHENVKPESVDRMESSYPTAPDPDTLIGKAVLEGVVVHVPDLNATREFPAALARQSGLGGHVIVPLLHERRAIGAIGVARELPGPYGDDQIAVLRTFAEQAVIAIENARLFRELEARNRDLTESMERQTATADVLRIIARSPTELQPVLDAIAASAVRLCAASDAVIERLDGDRFYNAAHAGTRMKGLVGLPLPLTRQFPGGRAILDRVPVVIDDIEAIVQTEYPDIVELQKLNAVRSVAEIPLLSEVQPLGSLAVLRSEVRPFTDTEIALLQTFADQAVIAIENVRLFTQLETRNRDLSEALEQQTATAQILRVISGSPTDIRPVFDAVAQNAARLCDASDALIGLREGDALVPVAHHGPIPMPLWTGPRPISREWVTGRAVVDRGPVHVPDLATAGAEFPVGQADALEIGHRTTLAVPLLREGEAIGVISIRRVEVRPFTDKQIALLQTFADQAVIAIENVRLFNELQERNRAITEALEQQTATAQILRVISRSPTDVQPVFEAIMESGVRLCDASFGGVFRFDGDLVHFVTSHQWPAEQLEVIRRHFPMPPGEGSLVAQAIRERGVVQVRDYAAEPNVVPWVVPHARPRNTIAIPMLRDGSPIGGIVLARAEAGLFSDQEIALLQTFADQAVIAIENVRLFKELEARNRDLGESLEQQTATAEILRLIGTSPTDAQPVFEGIARSGVKVLGALGCTVFVVDGEVVRVAATHGQTRARVERFASEFPAVLRDRPDFVTTVEQGIFHLADIDRNPRATPRHVEQARLGGYRTRLMAPMMRGDIVLGIIAVIRASPEPFSGREIELLKTFADQAVIAIENVRLFGELQARNRDLGEALDRQTATADILQAISQAQTDVKPVFDAIAESALRLFSAWGAVVWRYDGEFTQLVSACGGLPGSGEAILERFSEPMRLREGTLLGHTVRTRAVQQIVDIETETRYHELRVGARERG